MHRARVVAAVLLANVPGLDLGRIAGARARPPTQSVLFAAGDPDRMVAGCASRAAGPVPSAGPWHLAVAALLLWFRRRGPR